jgi:hypothetical protein
MECAAAAPTPAPDPLLIRTLIAARCRATDFLDPSQQLTISDIARREDGAVRPPVEAGLASADAQAPSRFIAPIARCTSRSSRPKNSSIENPSMKAKVSVPKLTLGALTA